LKTWTSNAKEDSMKLVRENPKDMPRPLGQYSHVTRVAASELLFIAGQLHDGANMKQQCDGIFDSIHKALRGSKADWRNVAQFTTYIVNHELIPSFMEWRLANFPNMFGTSGYPPNTLLVVNRLVEPQFLIEVQTIAVL
jgi:enamine deaminase RidA (YjgF/YER057c/UK114 family)